MFYRRCLLKRLIACGGIALALLGCVQQSHALCGLINCISPWLTVTKFAAKADAPRDLVMKRGGCCGYESEQDPELPCQDTGKSIPCGPNCWCCQPADPRQTPRESTELAESCVTALFVSAACPLCIESQPCEFNSTFLVIDFSADSSGKTCARLCRFLT